MYLCNNYRIINLSINLCSPKSRASASPKVQNLPRSKSGKPPAQLSEDSITSGVDGGHSRGNIRNRLVVHVLEPGVAIGRPDLPPLRPLHGLEGVLHELPGGGRHELEVHCLHLEEGGGQAEHLPVHVRRPLGILWEWQIVIIERGGEI